MFFVDTCSTVYNYFSASVHAAYYYQLLLYSSQYYAISFAGLHQLLSHNRQIKDALVNSPTLYHFFYYRYTIRTEERSFLIK
jgi:hypothetical protein